MAEENKTLIRVVNLKKDFGSNHVLRGINYEIHKGEKSFWSGRRAAASRRSSAA